MRPETSPDVLAAARREGLVGLLGERERLGLLVLTTRQLEVAAEVHERLLRDGVRTLPLKGSALAESLYASPAERPMADVDLLALDAGAGPLLETAGFRAGERNDHATAYESADGHWVEVHSALASCPPLHPFDAAAWWARRRTGSGRVPTIPSRADLLLQIGLHAAFQHGLALRLVQYVDVQRLAADPALDVGVLQAAPPVARASLGLTLAATARWIGGVPEGLLLAFRTPLPVPAERPAFSARSVASMRWALARGQRLTLLRGTLLPAHLRPRERVARALRLFRRVG